MTAALMAAAMLTGPGLTLPAGAATGADASACGKKYAKGYWWTYPTENVKFRSGPGTSYPVLGVVHDGDGLEVKCRAKKGGWLRVYVLNGPQEGRTGWVTSKYIH
ncbi:SH3 domain-containing protein [Streptomyces sp. NPDC087538]|uniref:SH3 domain-containing protein n=1 Tax=Streptomyces sp. NPDC087538 TaxID=3365797 RepID=UPI003820877B